MAKKSLLEENYQKIKDHILHPARKGDGKPELNDEQKAMLDRWVSAAKFLEGSPIKRHAVEKLMVMYPNISESQAYVDIDYAARVFNSRHTFDYDLWRNWLLEDIVQAIEKAKDYPYFDKEGNQLGTAPDMKAWNAAHANLIKFLGERPQQEINPKLVEKHDFYIIVQAGKDLMKLEMSQFYNMPVTTRKKISDMLFQEIDDAEVEEMLDV